MPMAAPQTKTGPEPKYRIPIETMLRYHYRHPRGGLVRDGFRTPSTILRVVLVNRDSVSVWRPSKWRAMRLP